MVERNNKSISSQIWRLFTNFVYSRPLLEVKLMHFAVGNELYIEKNVLTNNAKATITRTFENLFGIVTYDLPLLFIYLFRIFDIEIS